VKRKSRNFLDVTDIWRSNYSILIKHRG